MDDLRTATDDEVAVLPSWVYSFWRSMLREGRKEDTAKQYARTFLRLFEEDKKAPAEMASQTYFAITKASPKNKSGNGQRAASVAAFKRFYEEVQVILLLPRFGLGAKTGPKDLKLGRPSCASSCAVAEPARLKELGSAKAGAAPKHRRLPLPPDAKIAIVLGSREDGGRSAAGAPDRGKPMQMR
ncbi:unnamed protein product [Effrenium voratum]|nr:unnamed protein product [Effrenium voratum]